MGRWACAAAFRPRLFGVVLALLAAAASEAAAMTFDVLGAPDCPAHACVTAVGPIERETVEAFKAFVRRQRVPEGAHVFLSSEGGDHLAGIALGVEFRRLGYETFVDSYDAENRRFRPARCSSACVYAFMGGTQRTVRSRSSVGVHQVTIPLVASARTSISDAQWLMGMAAIHLQRMGATPDVMALALTTPPDRIRWLSELELRRFKVVTGHHADGE